MSAPCEKAFRCRYIETENWKIDEIRDCFNISDMYYCIFRINDLKVSYIILGIEFMILL